MFEMNVKNEICLTRGDSAYLDVTASGGEGEEVEIADAVFTVRKSALKPVVIQKYAKNGVVKIAPEDTAGLDFGGYKYDIQITTTDGDVSTFGPYTFKILEEVTY